MQTLVERGTILLKGDQRNARTYDARAGNWMNSHDMDEWEVVMGAFKRGKGFLDKESRGSRSKRFEGEGGGGGGEGEEGVSSFGIRSGSVSGSVGEERERQGEIGREVREWGVGEILHSLTTRDKQSLSCPATDTSSRRYSLCSAGTTGECVPALY
jgi:hypothetical protein